MNYELLESKIEECKEDLAYYETLKSDDELEMKGCANPSRLLWLSSSITCRKRMIQETLDTLDIYYTARDLSHEN